MERKRTVKLGIFDCTIHIEGARALVTLRDPGQAIVASGSGRTVSDAMHDAASKAATEDARRVLQGAVAQYRIR